MSFKQLYYITHINNIGSILKYGILSHRQIESKQIRFEPIYDKEIVSNRKSITTPANKSLWEYANIYFNARNPMLYRVLFEKPSSAIAILSISPSILQRDDIFISTGNAASYESQIISSKDLKKHEKSIKKNIEKEWWTSADGSKRKIMAECLVPDNIPSHYIKAIYVANHTVSENIKNIIGNTNIDLIPELWMFFEPNVVNKIGSNLTVVTGDMFFSKMQTLTVSVNLVGIMGKGLASRAKYQFPDVYVYYQDLCRKRILKMGKPYLYKRETSLELQLADVPNQLTEVNGEKWFLLFPTKKHWKEDSDFEGIEKGMQWLKDNYKKEGIKSLALPALGCGLGRLKWEDVGPMMCKYLTALDILVELYLPAEREIDRQFLSNSYLAQNNSKSEEDRTLFD